MSHLLTIAALLIPLALPLPQADASYAECSNGIDDDWDGYADFYDPGCSSPDDNSEDSLQFPSATRRICDSGYTPWTPACATITISHYAVVCDPDFCTWGMTLSVKAEPGACGHASTLSNMDAVIHEVHVCCPVALYDGLYTAGCIQEKTWSHSWWWDDRPSNHLPFYQTEACAAYLDLVFFSTTPVCEWMWHAFDPRERP